jgi:hypothetical protein
MAKTSKTANQTRETKTLSKHLTNFAAAKALIDGASTALEGLRAPLIEEVTAMFVKDGLLANRKPKNFTGVSDLTSSACQMQKRKSNSYLTEDEIKIAAANGIPTKQKVSQAKVPEVYYVNPILLANPIYRERIENALKGIDLGFGVEVLMKQSEVPEVSKTVLDDNALDVIFSKVSTPEKAKDLLQLAAVIALDTVFEGTTQDAIRVLQEANIKF